MTAAPVRPAGQPLRGATITGFTGIYGRNTAVTVVDSGTIVGAGGAVFVATGTPTTFEFQTRSA
jgi:hypothetical protein